MNSSSYPNANEKYSNGLDLPEVTRLLVLPEVPPSLAAAGFYIVCLMGRQPQLGPRPFCACTISFHNFKMVSFLSNNNKNRPYQNLSQNKITVLNQFCR